jgi:hypothetical protein
MTTLLPICDPDDCDQMRTTLKPYNEVQERMIAASGYRVKGRRLRRGGVAVYGLSDVMAVAAKTARRDREPVYVYATADGFTYGHDRPSGQRCYEMTAAGFRMID